MTLWPNTPVNSIQTEIWRRVGASDWNLNHLACRARSIINCLGEMIENSLIELDFRLVDLFCGDAVVLLQVQTAFPGATCLGVDVRHYQEHDLALRVGAKVEYCTVQSFIGERKAEGERRREEGPWDVVVMLNTFRGWDKAGLGEADADLPVRLLGWIRKHSRYAIVTATAAQVEDLKAAGWWVFDIGRGEDDSRMVCMFWSGIK